jgi:MraZ protein
VPVGTHILVVTPERFAGALATFRETALQDNTVAALERQLSEFLVDTTTDKVGRLPLTEEILEAAKIEKEALLMGRLEKFEIWNPDRFAATRETDAQLAADGFQNTTLRL